MDVSSIIQAVTMYILIIGVMILPVLIKHKCDKRLTASKTLVFSMIASTISALLLWLWIAVLTGFQEASFFGVVQS